MKIRGRTVSTSQATVYRALKRYGPLPDYALVPIVQHESPERLSSSGIRTRRSELCDAGLVRRSGVTATASGRSAGVFKAV